MLVLLVLQVLIFWKSIVLMTLAFKPARLAQKSVQFALEWMKWDQTSFILDLMKNPKGFQNAIIKLLVWGHKIFIIYQELVLTLITKTLNSAFLDGASKGMKGNCAQNVLMVMLEMMNFKKLVFNVTIMQCITLKLLQYCYRE